HRHDRGGRGGALRHRRAARLRSPARLLDLRPLPPGCVGRDPDRDRSRCEGRDVLMRFDRHELAGAVADLGVLVPIAVALIVKNGLSPTAVLLPAGLLYLVVAGVYRLPVPVQPLKALGAIAIAKGLGADSIAAAALLIGAIFLVLGQLRLLDFAARAFPRAIIRGVQLTVGLLFLKIAWKLVHHTPKSFADHAHGAG